MAKLINGNGNSAVYAAEDSDWFAAIMGNTTAITAIGEQFRADQADANTIEIFDGVIITQEGRRIQLDANDVDLFEIPTGTPGDTSYYIIGYHLVTDTDSNQSCETFVQKMDDGSETIPENTFRGGADEVYISLYRVTQTGLNITSIDLLLPSISNIGALKSALTDRNTTYYNGKLYQLNADGTRGAEIPMGARDLDYANRQSITITNGTTMTVAKDGVIYTSTESAVNALYKILVNGYEVFSGGFGYIWGPSEKFPVKAGDVITHSGTMNSSSCFIHFVPYL